MNRPASHSIGMIRPLAFLALAGFLIGAVSCVASYVPPGDPFAGTSDEISIDLTTVPIATVAAFKIRHAQAMPPIDVGLFGSSRILSVSASDLALPACRSFNFALSGESLRASTALLEQLAAIGKSPHITVVGIDNFESQFFGNPTWPTLEERWHLAWKDMTAGWRRPDVSAIDWLRMGWRHLHTEGEIFRLHFERRFVSSGLTLWQHGIAEPHGNSGGNHQHYRIDGSLSYEVAGVDERTNVPLPSAPEEIMVGYLRRDLERLAGLATKGRRIVIYEAPVAPVSALRFAREASPYAVYHRRIFLEECQRLGLVCHSDPGLFAPESVWRDASHPPPAPLGAYIHQLIREAAQDKSATVCGNDL